MKLTLRKNGKYYQAGYYEKGKWVNFMHIGTVENIVCNKLAVKDMTNHTSEHTKKIREELFKLSSKSH